MNTSVINLHENGIRLDLGGEIVHSIQIPSDYVPRDFAPVLGTHLLISGDSLKEGMIVLLDDPLFRSYSSEDDPTISDYERRKLNEVSRWALVTDLHISENGPNSRVVRFTAIYADGTMRTRTYNTSYRWCVIQNFEASFVCDHDDSGKNVEEWIEFFQSLESVLNLAAEGLRRDLNPFSDDKG